MTLVDLVTNYISKSLQLSNTDYNGSRGWVHLANIVLRDLEVRGLCSLNQEKEIGLEVENLYWITPPSDLRSIISIKSPLNDEAVFSFSKVNSKIKLNTSFEKEVSPDSFTLSGFLSAGVSLVSSAVSEDYYDGFLLVITNGDQTGKTIIIGSTAASSGGSAALTFLHAQSFTTSTSTTGYLIDPLYFLMLRYFAKYMVISQYDDVVPVSDDLVNAFIAGLIKEVTPLSDDLYKTRTAIYEKELSLVSRNEFTPTEDQLRPRPRVLPGYIYDGDSYQITVRSDE